MYIFFAGDLAGVGIGMLIAGLAVGSGMTFLIQVKQIHVSCQKWIRSKRR